MSELVRYYTIPLVEFLKEYKVRNGVYEIPMETFCIKDKSRITQIKYQLDNIIKKSSLEKIDVIVNFNYNNSKFTIKEITDMRRSFYLEFPYMDREDYIEFLKKVNNIIWTEGLVSLVVSNIPNYCESAFIIECTNEDKIDKIKKLIEEYKLTVRYDKGNREIMLEIGERKWNSIYFPAGCDDDMIEMLFFGSFHFISNKELQKKGYNLNKIRKRKQVFISYSHKDKDIVRDIVDTIRECGINAFIDYKSIDYGENILDSIMYGIDESDLNVVFISKAYKESSYAKAELLNIWDKFIRERAKWIIVNLDNIDPNEIKPGLGGYRYFEWENNSDELVEIIKGRIAKMN